MDIAQVTVALRNLLAEIEGNAPAASVSQHAPPGFVCITPSGPLGAGKSRLWPQPYANLANPRNGEMVLGYSTRCAKLTDPTTGKPYWQAGRWPSLPGFNPYLTDSGMAEMLDRQTYPDEWMSQEDLDRRAATAEANAGAPWVSTPEVPADVGVPIEGQ